MTHLHTRPLPLSIPRMLLYAVVIVGLIVLGGILFSLDPARSNIFPLCPWYTATGTFCPGCGSQRAMHQLLHGHVFRALGYNAMLVLCLPLIGYELIRPLLQCCTKRPLFNPFRRPGAIWLLFALIVAFWIARNLPLATFNLLAPG